MFDCQCCSLATITFLVQLTGLIIAIGFRLRPQSSMLNYAGLLLGITLMAGSCIACLYVDTTHAITQGVAVVAVAIGSTIQFGKDAEPVF